MSIKFKTIAEVFRGPGKDEGIEALLDREAKHGYSLVAFTAEPAQFSYRFIFSKLEDEKKPEKEPDAPPAYTSQGYEKKHEK